MPGAGSAAINKTVSLQEDKCNPDEGGLDGTLMVFVTTFWGVDVPYLRRHGGFFLDHLASGAAAGCAQDMLAVEHIH